MWLHRWYAAVQQRSSGPYLLLLDNFSKHVQLPVFHSVLYWFVLPKTTAVFQSMDQGVIAALKNTFRNILLQELVHAHRGEQARDSEVESSVPTGSSGVRDRCGVNIADGKRMTKAAWEQVTAATIRKLPAEKHLHEYIPITSILAISALFSLYFLLFAVFVRK